jgi:hypothetical protein
MQYKPENQDLIEAIAEFLRKDILTLVKDNDELAYKTGDCLFNSTYAIINSIGGKT